MDQAAFNLSALLEQRLNSEELYYEFLREPDLNCGIYVLPASGKDPQTPHDEDEVYYVISGSASFTAAGVDHDVNPGTILYVRKEVEHRFHSITVDLVILVFFASAISKG